MEKYKKFLRKMAGSGNEAKDKDNQGEKKKGADHKIPDDFGIQLGASENNPVRWDCKKCGGRFYSDKAYFAHMSSCRGQTGDEKSHLFRASDGRQIIITAESISHANIITAKTGLRPIDIILRIEFKIDGKKAYPVFNVENDVIWAVLVGINELVAEDNQLEAIEKNKGMSGGVKYCSHCGFEISQDSKFCSSCRAKQELAAWRKA
jgi:hypothetical protein